MRGSALCWAELLPEELDSARERARKRCRLLELLAERTEALERLRLSVIEDLASQAGWPRPLEAASADPALRPLEAASADPALRPLEAAPVDPALRQLEAAPVDPAFRPPLALSLSRVVLGTSVSPLGRWIALLMLAESNVGEQETQTAAVAGVSLYDPNGDGSKEESGPPLSSASSTHPPALELLALPLDGDGYPLSRDAFRGATWLPVRVTEAVSSRGGLKAIELAWATRAGAASADNVPESGGTSSSDATAVAQDAAINGSRSRLPVHGSRCGVEGTPPASSSQSAVVEVLSRSLVGAFRVIEADPKVSAAQDDPEASSPKPPLFLLSAALEPDVEALAELVLSGEATSRSFGTSGAQASGLPPAFARRAREWAAAADPEERCGAALLLGGIEVQRPPPGPQRTTEDEQGEAEGEGREDGAGNEKGDATCNARRATEPERSALTSGSEASRATASRAEGPSNKAPHRLPALGPAPLSLDAGIEVVAMDVQWVRTRRAPRRRSGRSRARVAAPPARRLEILLAGSPGDRVRRALLTPGRWGAYSWAKDLTLDAEGAAWSVVALKALRGAARAAGEGEGGEGGAKEEKAEEGWAPKVRNDPSAVRRAVAVVWAGDVDEAGIAVWNVEESAATLEAFGVLDKAPSGPISRDAFGGAAEALVDGSRSVDERSSGAATGGDGRHLDCAPWAGGSFAAPLGALCGAQEATHGRANDRPLKAPDGWSAADAETAHGPPPIGGCEALDVSSSLAPSPLDRATTSRPRAQPGALGGWTLTGRTLGPGSQTSLWMPSPPQPSPFDRVRQAIWSRCGVSLRLEDKDAAARGQRPTAAPEEPSVALSLDVSLGGTGVAGLRVAGASNSNVPNAAAPSTLHADDAIPHADGEIDTGVERVLLHVPLHDAATSTTSTIAAAQAAVALSAAGPSAGDATQPPPPSSDVLSIPLPSPLDGGKFSNRPLIAKQAPPTALAALPSAGLVAVGDASGGAAVWRLADGHVLCRSRRGIQEADATPENPTGACDASALDPSRPFQSAYVSPVAGLALFSPAAEMENEQDLEDERNGDAGAPPQSATLAVFWRSGQVVFQSVSIPPLKWT